MFGGWCREQRFHLEVAAGEDGHPLLPLQDVDDAARPPHLCCQSGRHRLVGPPSFGWVADSNSRCHLNLMARSRSWTKNTQPDASCFSFVISVVQVFDFRVCYLTLSGLEILSAIVLCLLSTVWEMILVMSNHKIQINPFLPQTGCLKYPYSTWVHVLCYFFGFTTS